MLSNSEQFQKNGFVHLKNVIDNQHCQTLIEELKRRINNNDTVQDIQCPLSDAIHGSEVFDKLLVDLLPKFEEAINIKLYPTYSYARLYKKGEELVKHQDRAACEISATLTLGFDDKVWPIYMGDYEDESNKSEICMGVGDVVLYKGMDKWHWREEFKGKWQAQVFLHYVNQNGPHAEWRYDKREKLGMSKSKLLDYCYLVENVLSDSFCDHMINEYAKDEVEKIDPHIGPENSVDKTIRDVQRVVLPTNQGIGATLTSIGLNVNQQTYKYDITHSNQVEFLIYKEGGKYEAHVDTAHEHTEETRKLTVLAFLNDDFEGGKLYLQVGDKKYYPKQTKGTILVFPSYILHGVEPVTKGVRYSVVTWMAGPYFR